MEQSDLPPLEAGPIDPREWFENPKQPLEIEIGCGKGTFLIQQARARPDINYLGFEWAREYFRFAADRARRHRLTSVRILHDDATEFLHYRCADAVASVVHLYFSDPWPKKRHHKRRVIQDRTLQDFHRVLTRNGEVRIVTDHQGLWEWCVDHAARHQHLFEAADYQVAGSAAAGEVVGSNFERKYRRESRPFYAMTLVKRPQR